MPHSRCNRARLRGSRLAYRRYDFASLRRDPGNARRLSCARCGLATSAATRQAQPMTSEPMSLGRHSSLARSTRFLPDSPVEEGVSCEPVSGGGGFPRLGITDDSEAFMDDNRAEKGYFGLETAEFQSFGLPYSAADPQAPGLCRRLCLRPHNPAYSHRRRTRPQDHWPHEADDRVECPAA